MEVLQYLLDSPGRCGRLTVLILASSFSAYWLILAIARGIVCIIATVKGADIE